ncbi:hypothetical protein Tco_0944735, partial [Tanacetum coccineum]
ESNSYQAHEDHKMLYEALEKSMAHDHTNHLLADLAEVRRKKKKRHTSPKTPLGSPPHQPPPPSPLASSSRTPGASGASGSSQLPPPPPLPPSNNQMNLRKNWWKPLTKDIPATPEPAWSIPSSDLPIPTSNMAIFIDWFCKKRGITELKKQDLEGPTYEIVKVFNPNVIHLQYQMEECYKLLFDQVDESIIRPALSISKMKAAYYPDVGLEQMVPDQIAVRTHMRILSVVRIKVFSLYGYDYMKKIVLRRVDLKEYTIAERDFKYMYPSNFEDLYLLNLQGHLDHLPPKDKKILTTATQLNLTKPRWDATGFEFKHEFTVIDSPRAVTFRDKYGVQVIMRSNEIHKFSDGTLHQIDKALDYRVKEFKKWLKTRRIFRNLESFVGRRVREGGYRLLQRTE